MGSRRFAWFPDSRGGGYRTPRPVPPIPYVNWGFHNESLPPDSVYDNRHCEFDRLLSFPLDWPLHGLFPKTVLAKGGLYWSKKEKEEVLCIFCEESWTIQGQQLVKTLQGQQARENHGDISTLCDKLQDCGRAHPNVAWDSPRALRNYAVEGERLGSFHANTWRAPAHPRHLARSGFYFYEGPEQDCTHAQCHFCELICCDWPQDMSVPEQHRAYSPDCEMVQQPDFNTTARGNVRFQQEWILQQAPQRAGSVEDIPEENLCRVCMLKPLDTLLLPCGHLTTCQECVTRLTTCPVCRQTIVALARAYLP